MEFMCIVFWVMCGLIAAYLYDNRGRSIAIGFLGGFLLGPLGIVLALVTPMDNVGEKNRSSKVSSCKMRRCQHCNKIIKLESMKCKFCGNFSYES